MSSPEYFVGVPSVPSQSGSFVCPVFLAGVAFIVRFLVRCFWFACLCLCFWFYCQLLLIFNSGFFCIIVFITSL